MAKDTKKGVPAAFAKRLATAGKSWGAAKEKAAAAGTGFTEIEDGKYMARLVSATIGEAQTSGRLQMVFKFRIEDEPYEGHEKLDFQGLETEQNLEYLAKRLTQLGYELPDDLTSITDIAADIETTKPLCRIRIKTKGEYQNVYIDKVFDPNELSEEDEDEASGDVPEETEEAPAPKKKGKAKPEPVEDEEESDEEESDEEEETDDEEEETDEEESDEVELTVGMTVHADTQKGEVEAEVLEILEDEGKARIKTADGRTLRIALDKISVPDDVPEEPKAKPKSKKK